MWKDIFGPCVSTATFKKSFHVLLFVFNSADHLIYKNLFLVLFFNIKSEFWHIFSHDAYYLTVAYKRRITSSLRRII